MGGEPAHEEVAPSQATTVGDGAVSGSEDKSAHVNVAPSPAHGEVAPSQETPGDPGHSQASDAGYSWSPLRDAWQRVNPFPESHAKVSAPPKPQVPQPLPGDEEPWKGYHRSDGSVAQDNVAPSQDGQGEQLKGNAPWIEFKDWKPKHDDEPDVHWEWQDENHTWNKVEWELNQKIKWWQNQQSVQEFKSHWLDGGNCWIDMSKMIMQRNGSNDDEQKFCSMREVLMVVVWDRAATPMVSQDKHGNSLVDAVFQWQYRDKKTWKDMSPMMHAGCLAHVYAGQLKGEHQVNHEYQNPYGKWKATLYTVNYNTLTETNPDSGNVRPIRLLAFSTLRSSAPQARHPIKGGGRKGVYQEGGAKSSWGRSYQ